MSDTPGPLEKFFEQYSYAYTYDSTQSATSEFHHLCTAMSWKRDDPDQKAAYEEFRDALVMEFNKNYGTDANDLTSWQTLCAAVRIDPIPEEGRTDTKLFQIFFVWFSANMNVLA